MILFCAVFYFRYGRLPLTEIKNNVWRADFKMQENVAAAMYSVGVHNFSVSCILESSTDIPVCVLISPPPGNANPPIGVLYRIPIEPIRRSAFPGK
jgi:hypothetical protein